MIPVARPVTLAALFACLAAAPGLAQEGSFDRHEEKQDYTRAYVSIGIGVALTASSFFFAESADRAYQDYLRGTDPVAIQDDYDKSVRLDRLSGAVLIAGQAALVLGVYWRFIKRERQPLPSETGGLPSHAVPAPRIAVGALIETPGFAVQWRF